MKDVNKHLQSISSCTLYTSCHYILFLLNDYSSVHSTLGYSSVPCTVYCSTPVYHAQYTAVLHAPQYTEVLQCTSIYWGTPVYQSILGYSSVPQYTAGVLQCTTVYWGTPVVPNAPGLSGVHTPSHWVTFCCQKLVLYFEHNCDLTPTLFCREEWGEDSVL